MCSIQRCAIMPLCWISKASYSTVCILRWLGTIGALELLAPENVDTTIPEDGPIDTRRGQRWNPLLLVFTRQDMFTATFSRRKFCKKAMVFLVDLDWSLCPNPVGQFYHLHTSGHIGRHARTWGTVGDYSNRRYYYTIHILTDVGAFSFVTVTAVAWKQCLIWNKSTEKMRQTQGHFFFSIVVMSCRVSLHLKTTVIGGCLTWSCFTSKCVTLIDGIGTACSVPHDNEESIIITFSRGPCPTEGANAAMAQNDRLTNQWSPVTGGSAAHAAGAERRLNKQKC